jgi:hypothetical protein
MGPHKNVKPDQSLNDDPRLASILKLPRPVRATAIGCALAGLFAFGALGAVQAQVEVSSSWNEATQRNNDPANPNTKGDGLSDHDGLNAGTDPLDPVSN